MKTNYRKSDGCRVTSDRLNGVACEVHARHTSHVTRHVPAFTLVELLVVMGIIGVLAGMLLAVAGAVKKRQYIYNTQAEMEKLVTAIENYKAAYGFYPPDSHNTTVTVPNRLMVNPLYYELTGTTNVNLASPDYYSLNDASLLPMTASVVNSAFGLGGFINCSSPGGGEDAKVARNFLPDLRPNQWTVVTNSTYTNVVLIASVGGPDQVYQPLGVSGLNPWRYNSSSPTNNPGSYDLWIQLRIGGKTNLICNWTRQVQVNSPLP
ncbi:MAG: type II secretion system protein [Limisphaerales bacterium]